MNKILSRSVLLILAIGSLSINFYGCGNMELASKWRSHNVVIDGSSKEWENNTVYLKDYNSSVGIMNDSNYIYIFFSSNDRDIQREMLVRGLIVWFDSTGGSDKIFGIKFPLGMEGNPELFQRRPQDENNGKRFNQEYAKTLNELEILGPMKNARFQVSTKNKYDIEASLGENEGNLTYELKVPLKINNEFQYGIGTDTSKTIGIGIEIPKPDFQKMREDFGGRRPDGGSFGERGAGRRGGHPPRERPEMKEVDFWVNVKLAGH